MKIIIPGGTGQVGTMLARAFHSAGHEVVILSRTPVNNRPWRVVGWDARNLGRWMDELDGAEVVINLAGRNVNCRYHAENMRQILESRVHSTRIIGAAISRANRPPRVWLQASTATIYAHRYDAPNDETTGLIGGNEPDVPRYWDYSIRVAREWEAAAMELALPATRRVLLRSSMTMSPDRGGVFSVWSTLCRLGLGGRSGHGKQFVSWIHEHDFIRAVNWLIENDSFQGAVNLCAPNPLPNTDFLRDLRAAWDVPFGFGVPAMEWMLELAAIVHRTDTELLMKSRRVVPGRLLSAGFTFLYPNWPEAARELVMRWRGGGEKSLELRVSNSMVPPSFTHH